MYAWSAFVPRLRGLSSGAKDALRSLADHAHGEPRKMKLRGQEMTVQRDWAWPAQALMAAENGVGVAKIGNGLRELLSIGLISEIYPATWQEPAVYKVEVDAINRMIVEQEQAALEERAVRMDDAELARQLQAFSEEVWRYGHEWKWKRVHPSFKVYSEDGYVIEESEYSYLLISVRDGIVSSEPDPQDVAEEIAMYCADGESFDPWEGIETEPNKVDAGWEWLLEPQSEDSEQGSLTGLEDLD